MSQSARQCAGFVLTREKSRPLILLTISMGHIL
nr:MAG TPA: hypothetical protein [Caudoviricetes sp.]